MNKENLILYLHAGSKNHGCEAIVNSLCQMLKDDKSITLISYRKDEDMMYSLADKCEIVQERSFDKHPIAHVLYYIYRKLTKDRESFLRFRYKGYIDAQKYPIAASIGGDNYCYDNMLNDLELANNAFNHVGVKTILLGCSIEPELLKNKSIVEDLKKYNMIFARESITYEALEKAGLSNVKLVPDSAFTLDTKNVVLPAEFKEGDTVGINISPMIQNNETKDGIALSNYQKLIEFILTQTSMNVALIPHVVWDNNDDRIPCKMLYDEFVKKGYTERLTLVPDASCEELKGYISKCRFFVGARTHSTIAAYSSLVPTLVVGYSVKARGIAKDLFPDYKVEDLVLQVQKLQDENELTESFKWMMEHESAIRYHLERKMPGYLSSAYELAKIVKQI